MPVATALPPPDLARRFGGIDRLYGEGALARLQQARVCVAGIGGVGSWAAEALARSGVGGLTLVDLDHVAESNLNRQAHALDSTLGQAKVEAMATRLRDINPLLAVQAIDDFLTVDNLPVHLDGLPVAVMVDAIDAVPVKVALGAYCLRRGLALVMAGSAGGKCDPARLASTDLARTVQDPLLARVRAGLRKHHGLARRPGEKFGIAAVYSDEPVRQPARAHCAPGAALACAGYGSSMMMTASMGLQLAALAVTQILKGRPQ